jgi:chromate transport protein ChrA
MAGAQAGAVAVLFGTTVRLLVTTCAERTVRGGAIALAVMLAVWSELFPPVLILLIGATAGGVVLGGDR